MTDEIVMYGNVLILEELNLLVSLELDLSVSLVECPECNESHTHILDYTTSPIRELRCIRDGKPKWTTKIKCLRCGGDLFE